MTAKPRVKCEKCGSRTKKKIGAGAGIIFKGSGFYETDYKKKSGSKPEPKAGESAASTPPKNGGGEKKAEKSDKQKSD